MPQQNYLPMPYHISSLDYLDRARKRLDEGTNEALFYAAFELRSGVEARMQEYLEAHEHIPAKHKLDYKISRLGKSVEQLTPPGERLVHLIILNEEGIPVISLYYTPVSEALRKKAEKLGDLLHAAKRFQGDDDVWWDKTRALLEEAWEELRRANTGELLGSPLLNSEDVGLISAAVTGEDKILLHKLLQKRIKVRVEHLDKYPDELLSRLGGPRWSA